MAQFAHLEMTLDSEGNVEAGGYNADPSDLLDKAESWEDVLGLLGAAGWELVQFAPTGDVTTYWFKKQLG